MKLTPFLIALILLLAAWQACELDYPFLGGFLTCAALTMALFVGPRESDETDDDDDNDSGFDQPVMGTR